MKRSPYKLTPFCLYHTIGRGGVGARFIKRLPFTYFGYFVNHFKKFINRKIDEKLNAGKSGHCRFNCYFSQGFTVAGA